MDNSVLSSSITNSPSTTINSRSTAIKTILLAAWRVKLSDEEWENRIRKILPRGVNGDVYDLADCLLKQALVGPVPNQLFISYLKHAVKTELVSHGAVLSSIAHQSTTHLRSSTSNSSSNNSTQSSFIPSTQQTQSNNNNNNTNNSGSIQPLLSQQQQQHHIHHLTPPPNRTSPIICLLEFIKSFRDKISCNGTEIECLNLCHSLNQLTHWLLKCILHSLESMIGNSNSLLGGNNNNNPNTANPSNTNINLSAHQMNYANVVTQNLTNSSSSSGGGGGGVGGISNIQAGGTTQQLLYNNNLAQYESTIAIIDLCTETIHYFINRPFIKSLLFISKIEYSKEFEEIIKLVQLIQQKFANNASLHFIQEKVQYFSTLQQLNTTFNSRDMHPSVVAAQQIRCLQQHRIRSTQISSGSNFEKKIQQSLLIRDSTTNYAIFNSLYSLIACDVILRPARSNILLARQIAIITNFNSAPIHMTYCELIRVCMIGFIDSFGTPAKVKWAFFTFLKMPRLLIELSKISQQSSQLTNFDNNFLTPNTKSSNFINDLSLAFERLCEYSPLLDEAEYKCNCDIFKCIVKELIRNDSSTSQELKNLDFRKISSKRVVVNNNDNNNSGVGGNMLLKTEPVVTTILQTLDSPIDLAELFDIISQLVSGKQFEFTLSCAASTGRLQLIVEKFIKHNELNKISQNDSVKSSLLFDISFLILTFIAQQYGAEVIDYNNQKRNATTTFKKWFHDCYNTTTRINCPKEMLKNCNPEIVRSLIDQLLNSDENSGGLKLKSVNWQDVCINIPKAISEILNAWYQGHLNDNHVEIVFEHIKSRMCFTAVITATWLQAHIRTLNDSDKSKPLSMLYNLTKTSQQAKQHKQSESGKGDHYSERSSLMCSIIRKIYFELAPKTINNHSALLAQNTNSNNDSINTDESSSVVDESSYQSINDKFISTLTAQEIFLSNVKQCLIKGWIDHKSLSSMNSLFKMIGSECWTNLIVELILTSHESPSDLSRAVNITYGLFHLDIEACAFALLKDTIPSWLIGEKKQGLLNQPRAFALAHLTVMTIIEVYSNLKSSLQRSTRKDVLSELEKKIQLNGIKQELGSSGLTNTNTLSNRVSSMEIDTSSSGGQKEAKRIKLTSGSQLDSFEMTSGSSSSGQIVGDVSERLNKFNECISDLMRLFKQIMSDSVMSQRTLFPVLFLQQTVVCTREGSTVITAHLQPEILLDIINLFSSELTFELVLAISNLSTTNSRKYAAKAMCQLAQVKESKQNHKQSSTPPPSSSSSTVSAITSNTNQTTLATTSSGLSSAKTIIAGSVTPMILG